MQSRCRLPQHSGNKRFFKQRCFHSGVTFIELLLAMVVLLVGMLAALGFLTSATLASANAQRLNLAKDLAADTLEQIFLMRDINAIGGISIPQDRNKSTFGNLSNSGTGIFKTTFDPIKSDIGADLIRGSKDDGAAEDPRFIGYSMRILIRSATVASNQTDPVTDPEPASTDQVRRIIVEVQYPLTLGRTTAQRFQKIRLESFITVPPSQTNVG